MNELAKSAPQAQGRRTLALTISILTASNLALYRAGGTMGQLLVVFVTSSLLYTVTKYANIKPGELGLAKHAHIPGLKHGSMLVFGVVTALVATFFIAPSIYLDSRYNQDYASALFAVFVFLPLRTVLFEEFAFRGVLLAVALRSYTQRKATVISSLLFGLWHITSSLGIAAITLPVFGITVGKLPIILGIIVATTTAGIVFCIVKLRSGSLISSMMAHWAINASGILIAAYAWNH